ncbi:E3 ubiquitin-protein ligase [Trichinella spiralis]|uniref:E3 ubiquitin-protein ligase n=1 Tax=Trichinella spiralis TaxID=6334 RepID=A0ABR3K7C1_TRISP
MSDVRDENKAPKTNEDDRAAKGNMQAPLVKKEKNRTSKNLTEEERIMLMIKESTEAYDPKYYVKIPERKRKSAWSSYCKRCRQEGHCIQNCPLNFICLIRTADLHFDDTEKLTANFPMSWLRKKKKRESPDAIA